MTKWDLRQALGAHMLANQEDLMPRTRFLLLAIVRMRETGGLIVVARPGDMVLVDRLTLPFRVVGRMHIIRLTRLPIGMAVEIMASDITSLETIIAMGAGIMSPIMREAIVEITLIVDMARMAGNTMYVAPKLVTTIMQAITTIHGAMQQAIVMQAPTT